MPQKTGWDSDAAEDYFGFGGWWGGKTGKDWYVEQVVGNFPHSKLLTHALYEHWSQDDEEGYKYLAEAYNQFVRKPDETPLNYPEYKYQYARNL